MGICVKLHAKITIPKYNLTNELYRDSIHILHEIYREYIYIYLAIFNGLIIRRTKHESKGDLSLSSLRIHQIQ